jgi:hypothetical protein
VHLHGEGSPDGWTGVTDQNGRYQIAELPAGRFVVSAAKGAYVSEDRASKLVKPPREIRLDRGQRKTDVDFRLLRGGVIAGRVTDGYGDPVPGLSINALRRMTLDGRPRLLPEGAAVRTDDFGRFRFFGLPSGEYYLSTFGEGDATAGLVRTYFPGTSSLGEAEALPVRAGEEVGGISFALASGRPVQITGIVVDSQGYPLTGGHVSAEDLANVIGPGSYGEIGPDGRFKVGDVSPGDYVLRVHPSEENGEAAAERISVGLDDISGLTIATSPPTAVTGLVVFESAPPDGMTPSEFVFHAASRGPSVLGGGAMVALEDDWTFAISLHGESLVIRPAQLPDGWGLKAVLADGVDAPDGGIPLSGRRRVDGIQLVLSARMASVSGHVTDARGRRVRSGAVVIFADHVARGGELSRQLLSTVLSEQGEYIVRHMPGGQYLALALDGFDPERMGDGDYLERLRGYAQPFEIRDGEQRRLDLEIVTVH